MQKEPDQERGHMLKSTRAQIMMPHALDAGYGVIIFKVWPVKFQYCFGLISPFFVPYFCIFDWECLLCAIVYWKYVILFLIL
jgi:hypothetical protein